MNDPKVEKQKPVPPFVQFCCAAIPQVFDDSLSYYEALCAMWKYLDETVKVINNNAMITEDFIAKVNELHDYVEHYFDNLDVQDEINNKLDEMTEDGTLQEIITAYIQANVAWTFDTVADMLASENLINGSYAKTLGFRSINDGGGAIYKVREILNTDVVDNMTILPYGDGDLICELSSDVIYPETLGAYADGTHDDYTYINKLIDLYLTDSRNIKFNSSKVYAIGTGIDLTVTRKINLDFNGSTLKALANMTMFKFRNHSIRNEPNGSIRNLNLNCNKIATLGLGLNGSWRITYENINILDIPIGGTGIKLSVTSSVKNGGNLFNNVRGTGVDNDDYSSASDYNTFIEITADGADNTFSNIDYTNIKRGIIVGAFNTFSNVHGFVSGDNMYAGSFFMKCDKTCIITNAYPDTQQFGIIVGNYPVSISNISFVFNDSLVSAEALTAHPSYGVVSTSNAGGRGTNIEGAMLLVSSSIQPLYPNSNVTEGGVTYYKPRGASFNSVSSILSTAEYTNDIMSPYGVSQGAVGTISNTATPTMVSGTITLTTAMGSSENDVASWSTAYVNYRPVIGLHPVVIDQGGTISTGYVRVADNYNLRIYGPLSNGTTIRFNIPLVRKKLLG